METTAASSPLIDVRHSGIGDVIVASWIVHSARAAGREVRLNPRERLEIPALLDVPAQLIARENGIDLSHTSRIGRDLEVSLAPGAQLSRFDAWCRALGLPRLDPVRPPYREHAPDGDWAEAQWRAVDPAGTKARILLFPEAPSHVRMWPYAYSIDLASALNAMGYAVAAFGDSVTHVEKMPCRWWGGFSVRQVAALTCRATLVVANDSGPAHLASTLGVRTLAVCGPSDPSVVFAHDPNVRALSLDRADLACVGCHFSPARGFRHACDVGGCQALMRLDPATVAGEVRQEIERLALAGGSPSVYSEGRKPPSCRPSSSSGSVLGATA
jgi:hypothetical protein